MGHTRWLLPETDPERAGRLAAEIGVSAATARVLLARGYAAPDAARRFLHPSLDDLHDAFLLAGMREAVDRLHRAIAQREKILLYGDYDVDGTTSVVILKKTIELAGGCASFYVPDRLKDGYGMRAEVIGQAAAEGVRLVISVDTGIRAAEVVRHARELGIDVIITDHHLPDAEIPPALAVLNPNRRDCGYPEKNICGCGVAFKLVQALFGKLDWPAEKRLRMMKSFLKLVAIGTVADVVPLTGENRILVKFGLEGLRSVRNPGLRALLATAGFASGDSPSATQVAFRVAPRINAAGRMANANDVIELFLTDDDGRARELAARLDAFNQERQQAEAEMVRSILEETAREPVTDSQVGLVFAGKDWHRGVAGIVASRLVDRFRRPVFVLSEEDGLVQGSGRSIPRFHLLEALESMPELFMRFGGHRQAAGVTLAPEHLQDFQQRFNAYAAAHLGPADLQPELEIDAMLDLGDVNDQSMYEILSLAPFGCGNPAPLFGVVGAEVAGSPIVMKEKHLRLNLRQNGRTVTCKAWNFAERLPELAPGSLIDAALTVDDDPYSLSRGYPGWSLVLRDVRAAR
jgi:single-stranded-DNA-specific exonuclease